MPLQLEELDVYALLNAGLELYHRKKPFEAHEIWEYAWGAEVGRTKLTLQALIQIAAALHKHLSGNPAGTSKLLAKAKAKLAEVREGASSFLGIDLVALTGDVDRTLAAADELSAGRRAELIWPALPARTGRDGILYLHGFASAPTSHKASAIVPALTARGLHVAVPDFNEGDFEHLTVSRSLALAKRCIRDRTLVIGSSLGGYLATLIAEKDDRVCGMVLMAPAFDFATRMRARYEDSLPEWKARGSIPVFHHAYKDQRPIAYALYEDGLTHPQRPRIRVPTYVLQGKKDDVVPPSMVAEVSAAYPGIVQLELVDDDHGLVSSVQRARDAALSMIDRLRFMPDAESPDPEQVLDAIERKG